MQENRWTTYEESIFSSNALAIGSHGTTSPVCKSEGYKSDNATNSAERSSWCLHLKYSIHTTQQTNIPSNRHTFRIVEVVDSWFWSMLGVMSYNSLASSWTWTCHMLLRVRLYTRLGLLQCTTCGEPTEQPQNVWSDLTDNTCFISVRLKLEAMTRAPGT